MEMTHPSATLRPAPADMAVAGAARGAVAGRGAVPDVTGGMGAALARGRDTAGLNVLGTGYPVSTGTLSSPSMKLADLAIGTVARVVSVSSLDSSGSAELGRRLAELGFLPGEKLRIVARGLMGREPLAVRIGTGTFALRLFEAACVRVCPEQPLLR
jgi:ferrous iron transport protein A